MRTPASNSKHYRETASPRSSGGCFSLLLFPPITVLLVVGLFFLIAAGETTVQETRPDMGKQKTAQAGGEIAPLFTPEVQRWSGSINKWANDWELDPNFVATVMQIESCGDPKATSHAGAIGLFQVMPFHFQADDSPYKPSVNAKRGLAYLRQGMDQLGDARLALAGYNGGIGTAAAGEAYWAAETIRYVNWGESIYQDARAGMDHSAALEEWLAHGGIHLCNQAHQRLGLNP